MRRLTPLVALGIALIAAVVAGRVAGRGEVVSVSPSDAALDLAHEVMSPFCPGLTLAACPSPAAFELRSEIRGRFDAGESREAIFSDLVGRFGRGIDGTPAPAGLGAVAWVAPVIVAAILGLAVRVATRKGAGTTDADRVATATSPSARQLARLDEELEQLEGGAATARCCHGETVAGERAPLRLVEHAEDPAGEVDLRVLRLAGAMQGGRAARLVDLPDHASTFLKR
jgi:cytochrome c-type biogenesis protein CcmH/NrfF